MNESRLETAKFNALNPEAYLRDMIAQIANHEIGRIGELLPWNWTKAADVMGNTAAA